MPNKPPRPFTVPTPPKPGSPGWLDARQSSIEQLVSNRRAAENHYYEVERHKPRTIPAGTILGGGGGGGNPGSNPIEYATKLRNMFGSSIVGYWPMWEPSGAVAYDIGGRGYNGAYTAVTLGQTGIGDGRTAASFDGSTSFNNVYSAGLAGAFNAAEGTLMVWAKVSAAGVWTDGVLRRAINIEADGNNFVVIYKETTNNTLGFWYAGAGTVSQVDIAAQSAITFIHVAVTWSVSADQTKAYINGSQVGSTQTGLGTWVGALAPTFCAVGARDTVPENVWSGLLAHALLLNRAATAAEIAAAYVVP